MFVAVVSKSAWHAVGEQIASKLVCVYKTLSETGQVRLASRDWRAEPIVEFNLLSDRRDLDRLMDGFRRFGRLHMLAAMREAVSDPFPASYSDRVRQIGVVNDKNRRLTASSRSCSTGRNGCAAGSSTGLSSRGIASTS